MKKGFTLIELLSVIVVIAVIVLITIPVITGVVEKARLGAAKDSTYGVLDASDLFNAVEVPAIKDKMVFKCDGEKCVNSEGKTLKIKGTIPTSGNVIINNKKVSSADLLVVSGYCFDGERENLKSAKNCYELDKTAPIVEIGVLLTRKNSLVVTYEIEEKESNIRSVVCKYGKDKNNLDKEVVGTEQSCELKNLEENKKYYFDVIATNLKGLEGKASGEGTTGVTSIEYSLTDPTKWTKSKTAKVTFNSTNITNKAYYIKTSVNTISNVDGYICEGDSEPGNCETTSTKNYVAGKWYKVNGNPSIIFNSNGTLYALIHDGGTYSSSLTENVDYIDNEAPTNPTEGSIGAVSGSNKTGSIQTEASGSTDNSGSVTYKYIVTNTNEAPANTDERFTISRDFTRSCGTSYYAWAIAEDAVGNKSEVVSLGNTSDGANSYSDWSGCNKACGGGTQTRTNTCALITSGLSQSCNTQSCCSSTKIGSYGSWSGWSTCSKTCDGGTQTRTRTRYYVSNYDGSSCGTDTETGSQTCNTQACGIDTCPGCYFTASPRSSSPIFKTGATSNSTYIANTKSYVSNGVQDYKQLGKNYFIGYTKASDGMAQELYLCGIESGRAFCYKYPLNIYSSSRFDDYVQTVRNLGFSCYWSGDLYICRGSTVSLYCQVSDSGKSCVNIKLYNGDSIFGSSYCTMSTDGDIASCT